MAHTEVNFSMHDNLYFRYLNYYTTFVVGFANLKTVNLLTTAFFTSFHVLVVFMGFFILVHACIDIKCYITNTKTLLDLEQTSASLTTESEKEIASIDDILPLIIILVLTFGFYFNLAVCGNITIYCNSYVYTFVVLPLFFGFVFIVPAFLLYDFGLFAFIYLRGSGNTALLNAELLYDIINLFAYYIRVVIQSARLILMLTALGSYQELIFENDYSIYFLTLSEVDMYVYGVNMSKYSIFNIFIKIISILAYIVYEILHTYFVLTIQTIAFFAMVFWLFFYLFSFFVSEPFEKFFEKRRLILNFKNEQNLL